MALKENLLLNVQNKFICYIEIMNMKKLLILIGMLMLGSCASIQNANSPDFEKTQIQSGIFLSCDGYKTWKHCYESAEKACQGGYSVISMDENHLMQARTLRIECKK